MHTNTMKIAVIAVIAFTLVLAIPAVKNTWQGAKNFKAQQDVRHAMMMKM